MQRCCYRGCHLLILSSCCTEAMLSLYSIRFPIHHQGWLVVEVMVVLEDVMGRMVTLIFSHKFKLFLSKPHCLS